jgi:hypothetical protein
MCGGKYVRLIVLFLLVDIVMNLVGMRWATKLLELSTPREKLGWF